MRLGLGLGLGESRVRAGPKRSECRRQFRGKVGSDGFKKVLIGTRGARETLLQGRKGRAAKNSVLTSGAKQLKC